MPVIHRLTTGFAALAVTCIACQAFAADKVEIGNASKEFPESMTSLSDGTLFFGSLTYGNVTKAAPGDAQSTEFIPAQTSGPQAVLGVYADEPNGTLWVCYSDLAGFSGKGGQPAMLRSFDVRSGELKAEYTFGSPSICNDTTTTADGTAYAADTAAGAVIRIRDGKLETFMQDERLAGADGISLAPDGSLYVNSVTQNKLFHLPINSDGSAGDLTEIATSQPLQGPDGMRFDEDGTLFLAENQAGIVAALTIDGDKATVTPLPGSYTGPTAVSKVGNTLWVLEAKIGLMGQDQDPGAFYAYPVDLGK